MIRTAQSRFSPFMSEEFLRSTCRDEEHYRIVTELARLCGADLHDDMAPDGAALRSSVAGVATDIVRDDRAGVPSYLLHCERSSGQYLFGALTGAGESLGIGVDGFRLPAI